MPNFIFLDTNIFLHYEDFDRINWLEILGVQTATIVIPPVTIRELNKQKDTLTRARIKNRAGTTLRKLSALFEESGVAKLSDGLDILLEDRDPLIDFEKFQLSREVQDDQLIASILMYQEDIADAVVTLVTSDAGLTLVAKANRLRISTKKLDDRFKLPQEPNPDHQRIKELEQELREIRQRQPRLSLTFENRSQHKGFTLFQPTQNTATEIEAKLGDLKQRHPKLRRAPDPQDDSVKNNNNVSALIANLYSLRPFDILPADIDDYNTKLEDFYDSYADYLQQKEKSEEIKSRTITLPIWIVNEGSAPAEDIDVFMHFPDGFDLVGEDDIPSDPQPPRPPSKPKTKLEKLQYRFSYPTMPDLSSLTRLPVDIGPPPNVTTPSIKRSRSYDVNVHVRRLKHKLREPFDRMYLIFASVEAARSFHLDYQILAANLPDTQVGRLHVIIEQK